MCEATCDPHEIICPYCGYHFKDSWRFDSDECEKQFMAARNVTITFTGTPIEDKQP